MFIGIYTLNGVSLIKNLIDLTVIDLKLNLYINNMKKHTFISDPAHGWLKVKISDLKRLKIEDKISGYSYMRGEYAYLEEDCDMTLYLDAIGVNSDNIQQFRDNLKDSFSNKQSKVRSYESYKVITPEEQLKISELKEKMLRFKNWGKRGRNKILNASLEDLKYWRNHYGF